MAMIDHFAVDQHLGLTERQPRPEARILDDARDLLSVNHGFYADRIMTVAAGPGGEVSVYLPISQRYVLIGNSDGLQFIERGPWIGHLADLALEATQPEPTEARP